MAEDVAFKLNLDAGDAPKTLGELKKRVEDINSELEKTPIGTQNYKDLEQELIKNNKQLKNLELNFEALDVEQQATELGSVAGAVGDVTSAFILLGGESETLEQIAANIEKAIGVSMAFKGAIEGVASARKLLNSLDKESFIIKTKDLVLSKARRVAELAMIGVTKLATTATTLFNAVLNANPIMLIVTGVGLLITGIVALVKNFDAVSEAAKKFGKFLLMIINPFTSLLGLTKDLRTEEEKAADSRKKQTSELRQQTAERLKQIDEVRKQESAAHKQRLTGYDLEIKRLEAEGKSSFKVRLEMLEDILAEKKAVLEANNQKIQSYIDYYTNLAALRGQDLETFKASMKAQGTDLDALQQQALDQQQTLKDAIFQAETDIIALKRKRSDQQKQISDKARQEEAQADEKALQDKLKRIDEEAKAHEDLINEIVDLENEYFDSLLTDQEREENAVQDKYFNLIEQARQYNEDISVLEEAREAELFKIRQEFAEKQKEIEDAKDEEDKQKRLRDINDLKEQTDNVLNTSRDTLNLLSDINSFFNEEEIQGLEEKNNRINELNEFAIEKDIAGIKEKIKNKKKLSDSELKNLEEFNKRKLASDGELTKKELKLLQQQEKRKKAFAIANAAIDTASSIASVIAGAAAAAATTGPAAPFVLAGYIASGLAAVFSGFKQVTSILKTPSPTASIDQTGGGVDLPDISDTEGDAPDTDLFNTGSTLLNIPPIKVAVLEQDITDTQTNVAGILEQATFG